jgi:hypothetical protein
VVPSGGKTIHSNLGTLSRFTVKWVSISLLKTFPAIFRNNILSDFPLQLSLIMVINLI